MAYDSSINRSRPTTSTPDIWTVNNLSEGMSIVYWEIRGDMTRDPAILLTWNKKSKLFSYRGCRYQLSMTHQLEMITLTMHCVSSGTRKENPFSRVTAMHNGEAIEMKRSADIWGPVQFKSNSQLPGQQGSYCFYPNFQLVLEYEALQVGQKLAHLSKLLDTKLMSDVQFIVQGKAIGAHLAIMASASPVMAAMFEPGRFQEGAQRLVKIVDIEVEVFEQMLRFVYTSVAPKMAELAESLLVAADKYQIDALKHECELHLGSKLTVQNMIKLLVLAHKHSASNLLESCLCYLKSHSAEVWNRPEWRELSVKHPAIFYLATCRLYATEGRKRKLGE